MTYFRMKWRISVEFHEIVFCIVHDKFQWNFMVEEGEMRIPLTLHMDAFFCENLQVWAVNRAPHRHFESLVRLWPKLWSHMPIGSHLLHMWRLNPFLQSGRAGGKRVHICDAHPSPNPMFLTHGDAPLTIGTDTTCFSRGRSCFLAFPGGDDLFLRGAAIVTILLSCFSGRRRPFFRGLLSPPNLLSCFPGPLASKPKTR